MLLRYACFLLLLSIELPAWAESPTDFHTALMRSTFKIMGAGPKGTFGTVFILGKPIPADSQKVSPVLITAAHILQHMPGDYAGLFLRKKEGERYTVVIHSLRIRQNNTALWTTHPSEDIAVMYVSPPPEADIPLLSTNLLATDEILQSWGIHPGDRLFCLGYPLGIMASIAGFPVLRSGHIASYPLVPTQLVKSFLFDFNVFAGDSGGPVYLMDDHRRERGGGNVGPAAMLVGLVKEQKGHSPREKDFFEEHITWLDQKLNLGVVIHASLIREALELLPTAPLDGTGATMPR